MNKTREQGLVTHRTAFNRQPARMLLVDLQPPSDPQSIDLVCKAVEEVFSTVCCLSGPTRVPFFGIVVIGNYPEVLFPLQHLRGNYPRLQSALGELRALIRDVDAPTEVVPSRTVDGLREATSVIKRQSQSLLQTAGYMAQLEVTLITCQQLSSLSKQLDNVVKDMDLDGIKKLQVVTITNPDSLYLPDDVTTRSGSQASEGSDHTSSSGSGDTSGIFDFKIIENNVLCIQNLLMNWLHDCGTDQEHLHIVLPPADGDIMTLKCDLHERVLSPRQLPFPQCFDLSVDAQANKSTAPTTSRPGNYTYPIHRLSVIRRIPSNAVCESVLYGMPHIVRATTCWKIDWDELETNQQHFGALCRALQDKNELLLIVLDTAPAPTDKGFRYNAAPPEPSGHFLLLPSQGNSLLLKPIATKELLLPLDVSTVDQPSDECLKRVYQALEMVGESDGYNPLMTSSNLHISLDYHLTKNLPGGASNKRKLSSKKETTTTTGTASGSNVNNKLPTNFTSAHWTFENQKRSRGMTSGRNVYNTNTGEYFPTEL